MKHFSTHKPKNSPLYTPPALKRQKLSECTKDLDGAYRWNHRLDGGKNGKAPNTGN